MCVHIEKLFVDFKIVGLSVNLSSPIGGKTDLYEELEGCMDQVLIQISNNQFRKDLKNCSTKTNPIKDSLSSIGKIFRRYMRISI